MTHMIIIMADLQRLVVPTFDLTWAKLESSTYVLIPGGGGSLKVRVLLKDYFFLLIISCVFLW